MIYIIICGKVLYILNKILTNTILIIQSLPEVLHYVQGSYVPPKKQVYDATSVDSAVDELEGMKFLDAADGKSSQDAQNGT